MQIHIIIKATLYLFIVVQLVSSQDPCYLPQIISCNTQSPCSGAQIIIGLPNTFYECQQPLNLSAEEVILQGGNFSGGIFISALTIEINSLRIVGDAVFSCGLNMTVQKIINITGLLLIGEINMTEQVSLQFEDATVTAQKAIIGVMDFQLRNSSLITTSKPCLYELFPITTFYQCTSMRTIQQLKNCTSTAPTTILIFAQNISVTSSLIRTTVIVINSQQNFIMQNSILNTSAAACHRNMGQGKGLESQLKDSKYCTSGASGAGYGTFSQKSCYLIIQYFMFLTHSFPYLGKGPKLSTGSGGYGYGPNSFQSGNGGGIIIIFTKNEFTTSNSSFLAEGGASGGNFYESAGSGGMISVYSESLTGQSSLFSVSGGPSYNNNGSGAGGVVKISPNLSQFNLSSHLFVNISQGYQPINENTSLFFANGTFYGTICRPGFFNNYLECQHCPSGTYSLLGSQTCLPCPTNFEAKQSNTIGNPTISACFVDSDESTFFSWINPKIGDKWEVIVIYIITLIVFLVIGLLLKKKYKKKLSIMETEEFSLEEAKKDAQDTKIITENLKHDKQIKFQDLLFHVHRITLIGRNTPHSPWMLPETPPSQIRKYILLQGFMDFSYKFNQRAKWSKLQKILCTLSLLVYPLYWLYFDHCKKKKYKKILALFQESKEYNLLNNYDFQDKNTVTIKISKNTDYTICYIDFMVYDRMDPKYFNLSTPFIISLSGEGNFLRPFYLQDRDIFFNCLFYIVNRTKQKLQQDKNSSEKLLLFSNLVSQKKRQQNNCRLIQFLKKFNRNAITLDLSSPINNFINQLIELIAFITDWNQNYFCHVSVQLDLILMISKFKKTRILSNQIHILTNKEPEVFREFISSTLPSMNRADKYDLKLGLFVYNPDQEIENQRKQSIKSMNSGWVAQQIGLSEEESIQQPFMGSQIDQQQENSNKKNKQIKFAISRFFMLLRYYLFCHRKFFIDKDNLEFFLISVILCQALFVFIWPNHLELPYVGVNFVTPFIGIIFVVSSSYGIGKLYLVFNAMAFLNQITSTIIELILLDTTDNNYVWNFLQLFICQFVNIICNILVIVLGTRFLTVSRKLSASKMFK